MHFLLALFAATILMPMDSHQRDAGIGMPGGSVPQDVNDSDIKKLADKAVAKISAESNGAFQLIPVEILSAKSQVVAGVQYTLKIRVGQSSCRKNQASSAGDISAGECAAEGNNQDARKVYTVTIWQKPWENFEQITYSEDGQDAASQQEEE